VREDDEGTIAGDVVGDGVLADAQVFGRDILREAGLLC
jgi:hypothetical protein